MLVRCSLAVVLLLLCVPQARAADGAVASAPAPHSGKASPQHVLDYSSAEGCPTPKEFQLLYHRHVLVEVPANVVQLDFRLERADGLFQGSVTVSFTGEGANHPASGHWMREIRGAECTELVHALLMSLSLYLDSLPAPVSPPDPGPDEGSAEADEALRIWDDESRPLLNAGPAMTERVRPPPNQGKRVPWGIAPMAGLRLRLGLLEQASWAGSVSLDARGLGEEWGAARFGVGFDFSSDSVERDTGEQWLYRWWAASGHACPIGFRIGRAIHFMPCTSAHFGAYQGPAASGNASGWLGFWELRGEVFVRRPPFVGQFLLGMHGPMDFFIPNRRNDRLYDQGVGLVVGFGVGLLPDAWVFW